MPIFWAMVPAWRVCGSIAVKGMAFTGENARDLRTVSRLAFADAVIFPAGMLIVAYLGAGSAPLTLLITPLVTFFCLAAGIVLYVLSRLGADAAALREGTEVIIRSRVSDQTWKGSVDTVDWNNPVQQQSYYDSDTSLSSKYPFYVALDEGDGLLLGQHVYIEPDYGQEDEQDASAINLPSYFISDPDGKPWVWAQSSKGKLEKRDLKLGEYNADTDTYPVLEGLTAEDYIAYPDESLKAGMACVTYDDATFDPGTNGGTNGGVDGGMIDGSADVPTDEGGYVDGGQRVDGDDSGVVTMPAVEG